MPKYATIDGKERKILVRDFKSRKANAYTAGCLHHPFKPEFLFEQEYYRKGESDDTRLRLEQKTGDR